MFLDYCICYMNTDKPENVGMTCMCEDLGFVVIVFSLFLGKVLKSFMLEDIENM